MSESEISDKKYAWFWEKEYKTRGEKMEPIVTTTPNSKPVEGLYFAGAFILTSAVIGELKLLHREGALLNPAKAMRLYGQRGMNSYQAAKSRISNAYQRTKGASVRLKDSTVDMYQNMSKKFEEGYEGLLEDQGLISKIEQGIDNFGERYKTVQDITNKRVVEPLMMAWSDAKSASKRIKVTIRGNNKNEISIFANYIRQYSGDNQLPMYFTNSTVPQIPTQDYHSFPVDDQKIGAMFSDKKIYLQNSLRPEDGPFYQVEAIFDAKYSQSLDWFNFINKIFTVASSFNESSPNKYDPTMGNFGVQVIIEAV